MRKQEALVEQKLRLTWGWMKGSDALQPVTGQLDLMDDDLTLIARVELRPEDVTALLSSSMVRVDGLV